MLPENVAQLGAVQMSCQAQLFFRLFLELIFFFWFPFCPSCPSVVVQPLLKCDLDRLSSNYKYQHVTSKVSGGNLSLYNCFSSVCSIIIMCLDFGHNKSVSSIQNNLYIKQHVHVEVRLSPLKRSNITCCRCYYLW